MFESFWLCILSYAIATFLLFVICQRILAWPCLHTLKCHLKYGIYHVYVICITGSSIIPALFRPGSSDNFALGKILMNLSQPTWWFGVEIEKEGLEHFDNVQKPIIIVCNHQTSLDLLCLVQVAPRRTAALAKKELLKVPFFGLAARLCGTIFIDRTSHQETVNTMKETAAEINKVKTNVWVFPEGTRKQIDGMLPFKKGAFHLAIQAQIPVVPVVIGNCRNFIDLPNKIFESGTMRVKVLPPIPTEGLTTDDVLDLTSQCRNAMLKTYHQITEDHKEEYANLRPLPEQKKQN